MAGAAETSEEASFRPCFIAGEPVIQSDETSIQSLQKATQLLILVQMSILLC